MLRWHQLNGTYPARTIKATLYDNEEGGLVGSGQYSAAGTPATLLQEATTAGATQIHVGVGRRTSESAPRRDRRDAGNTENASSRPPGSTPAARRRSPPRPPRRHEHQGDRPVDDVVGRDGASGRRTSSSPAPRTSWRTRSDDRHRRIGRDGRRSRTSRRHAAPRHRPDGHACARDRSSSGSPLLDLRRVRRRRAGCGSRRSSAANASGTPSSRSARRGDRHRDHADHAPRRQAHASGAPRPGLGCRSRCRLR